ncbi:MAG: FAD-binding domain-containing protein [Chromatiales bacterium]|jgi:deoxyribodipyrimidine photo-lyase
MLHEDSQKDGFDTDYARILEKTAQIDPVRYAKTRNYSDGAVTRLSPYISRGVISTRMMLNRILEMDLPLSSTEKLIQELAWRDYWQQVWHAKGEAINGDLKHRQQDVLHEQMPLALEKASTGIETIDNAIDDLYETGYMHNHMRMYVASVACNIGKSHWRVPALWMYYHLLDGDWASNALSWQWVAGSNANKKYLANQDNINRYFHSGQKNTFLDRSYEELADMPAPAILEQTCVPSGTTDLPSGQTIGLQLQLPTLVYNYYNLDPEWRKEQEANRILLLEPSVFRQYPVAQKNIAFILKLAENIPGIQLYCAEFDALQQQVPVDTIVYKEHPLNRHYRGHEEPREWMFTVEGYFPSFFKFWKRCKKELASLG